ncbi:MAG: hypothetical protein ACHQ2E_04760 [Gemmatimonadales bacterium]
MIVDPYLFALLLGAVGLLAMAALGLGGHSHGAGIRGHHGHGGAAHTHHAEPGAGHGHASSHGHGGAAQHGPHHPAPTGRWLLLLSPRVWFTLLVGFGAGGLLARPLGSGLLQLLAGVAGAVLFEGLLVRPLWNFLARFESNPAQTLEHGVMDEAEAVSGFNASGEGLVRMTVDGQVVQLLGTLRTEDLAAGIRVRTGDRVIIESIDSRRQRCVVSAAGHSLPSSRQD